MNDKREPASAETGNLTVVEKANIHGMDADAVAIVGAVTQWIMADDALAM
ncbi:MAG: hypothetical protein SGI73_11295 [Chloroflexota bacterium]|nr:hypothetical protein [Chloroflexota bacterium]